MNQLELQIYKQMIYCTTINHFKSVILLSSKEKRESMRQVFFNLANKYFKPLIYKKYFNQYDSYVVFKNGSVIKLLVLSDHIRGEKYNGCLIDEDISTYVKQTFIFPKMMPILNSDIYSDSWESVKKRVSECKI